MLPREKGAYATMTGSKGRVGVVFSGGPAPAANAVISAAASCFRRDGYEFVGFLHGYSGLAEYDREKRPLVEGTDYRIFRDEDLRGLRNSRGIFIGTARTNPGKGIQKAEDLKDAKKTDKLSRVYRGLVDLGLEALISIGGDDTLKTANFLYEYQKGLPSDQKRVRVVHLPKTIDNDYRGIDFTFGFFTAVDVMAQELQNLRADALATGFGDVLASDTGLCLLLSIGTDSLAGGVLGGAPTDEPGEEPAPLDDGRDWT